MAAGRFIRAVSTNPVDVREFALAGLDLGSCCAVLDLGCAYGFFTRALAGRLPAGARVTGVDLWPRCSSFFLDACREAGLAGTFLCADPCAASPCAGLADGGFDVILCTYALYFFPAAIADLARVLKPGGLLVVVTHCVPHMAELVALVKEALAATTGRAVARLPLEDLFPAFSDVNGARLLAPVFRVLDQKRYANTLRVDAHNLPALIDYLCFKRIKFIPADLPLGESFIRTTLADHLRRRIATTGALTISKHDMVFVCRRPGGEEG